jgi:HAD domain in Swiss Army Knife RNA repair proteins
VTGRPILAVDVDGVLNAISDGKPPEGWQDAWAEGFRIRYNPGHGARLLVIAEATGSELTWCTTWEELANQHIRQLVGLPELPWVPMEPGRAGRKFSEYRSTGATKVMAMRAYAGDRPFCWLDDEPDAADELRSLAVPHLVVYVDDSAGLQDEHFAAAQAWLAALPECREAEVQS